ncbi:hypothetical protein BNJ_00230 [Kaumoebavirus]|uniref:hypothetical protein n=1 Tax=Kaumoebavirus TaxID=1859492 RepID=UPI0009C22F56|nr:hypothetical protein BNJ_00230 [Kaumoebavirus]ARA72059.1 hypothetical protein BNJ_00230 [Kaumoebavirus]
MDTETFAMLCQRIPREIARLIEEEVLRHPRAIAKMVRVCVEKNWENAIRVSDVYPFKYRVVLWLPYCRDCGNLQIDTISNFVKIEDTDAKVKKELMCEYDLFQWKPNGCAARCRKD